MFLLFMSAAICVGVSQALVVKNFPANEEIQETWTLSLGQEDQPESEMATPSRILAWEIP